jgi:FkbM family methyltransferase
MLAIALGRYEREVVGFLSEILPSAQVFFDIGAYTGIYCRLARRLMNDTATIVAFEPDARAQHRLMQALGADPRVIVRREAVGDDDGTATLSFQEGACSRIEGVAVPFPGLADSSQAIHVRSIDSLVRSGDLPAPDVVKVDVEGGELSVLRGMEETLATRKPAMAVECHSMVLLHDVLGVFLRHGYERIVVIKGGDHVGPPTVLAKQA